METGYLLTGWTARVAMLLYVVGLAFRVAGRPGSPALNRWTWTAGCFVYLLHVASAFQFVHHWSNAAAFAATARRTQAIVGLDWGGGLYVNYAFTLVWVGDVSWWWFGPEFYKKRSRITEWLVQGFLGFIAFNATVVFVAGGTRWVGVGACLLLAGIGVCQKTGSETTKD